MTKIINLLGSSGSGKSTIAASLFAKMKMKYYKVELVHEYAKMLTWEQHFSKLKNQCLVLGKQSFMLDRLIGQVDYIISDSPLILSTIYTREDYPQSIKDFAIDLFRTYENINFFIRRVKPFIKLGRNETEEQSDTLAKKLRKTLDFYDIKYVDIDGDEEAPQNILDFIKGI